MRNRYKVLLPVLVNGEHKQGDIFAHEFDSAEDEKANLDSGLLELQPNTYKVVGDSRVFETATGDEFTRPLTWGEEELLVAGGHIERVSEPEPEAAEEDEDDEDEKPAPKKTTRTTRKGK